MDRKWKKKHKECISQCVSVRLVKRNEEEK